MISKDLYEEILCKYPELIEPGYVVRGRHVNLYGQQADILLEDAFGKRLVVQVHTSPIEQEKLGDVVCFKNAVLSGESTDVSVMLVADKMPVHLKKTFEHNSVAWKEITVFQIKEHLGKRNDQDLLAKLI